VFPLLKNVILSNQANVLERCLEYSNEVFDWCIENPIGPEIDTTTLLLFRHILEMIDSIPILIREGCTEPATPILRSALEAVLGLEYILTKDTKIRSLAYQVSYIRKTIKIHRKFSSLRPDDNLYRYVSRYPSYDPIKAIQHYEELLKKQEYKDVDNEWKKTKARLNREPNWYSLFHGPRNLKELAEVLNREDWYEILYRYWSSTTHAIDPFKNLVLIKDKTAGIKGFRSGEHSATITSLSIGFLLKSCLKMIDLYVPSKKIIFSTWYLQHLSEDYLKLNDSLSI
jgi:hypothetical protein